MKTSIPLVALYCNALIFLNSCAISNNSVVQHKPDVENTKETSATCYVIRNDGTVEQYSSLKLVTGVLITPHLLADNRVIINAKDIKTYQNDKCFAVSPKSLTTAKTNMCKSARARPINSAKRANPRSKRCSRTAITCRGS